MNILSQNIFKEMIHIAINFHLYFWTHTIAFILRVAKHELYCIDPPVVFRSHRISLNRGSVKVAKHELHCIDPPVVFRSQRISLNRGSVKVAKHELHCIDTPVVFRSHRISLKGGSVVTYLYFAGS